MTELRRVVDDELTPLLSGAERERVRSIVVRVDATVTQSGKGNTTIVAGGDVDVTTSTSTKR